MADEQTKDDTFYQRADAHIHLSNDQMKMGLTRHRVSASHMFSSARFNAWVSSRGWQTAEQMKEAREETIEFFMDQYRKMLESNMDDYIRNFDRYRGRK